MRTGLCGFRGLGFRVLCCPEHGDSTWIPLPAFIEPSLLDSGVLAKMERVAGL